MTRNKIGYAVVLVLVAAIAAPAQVAAGGGYTLDQAVIAGGGGSGTGGNYTIEGTTAQSITGNSTGPVYSVRGGFWGQAPLAPSAAGATISGRVLLENGGGLRNARVILEGGRFTSPRIVYTGSFGYFSFEDVETGQAYTLSVTSKKYTIENQIRVISLMDDLTDVDFQATLPGETR